MQLINQLKIIVLEDSSKGGRIFDLSIQALIILSTISFTIETLPGLSENISNTLVFFDAVVIVIFATEYLLRIILSENKKDYVFSFLGIIDFLAAIPVLLFGLDLRFIRVFRLIRVFRTLKLFRYNESFKRLLKAIISVKDELFIFIALSLLLLYVSAVGIYVFENEAQPEVFKSIIHSLWWALATLTTVGYGDIYPVTAGGKLFSALIIFIGIGIVAIPTGLIASALTKD